MILKRHLPFLKQVMLHSISAFGGPQGHYGMMLKTFVEKRRDISEKDLLDITSFCNMLPGASSTQTLTLIGYKRGGLQLAFLTLLIWVTPACTSMGLLSFLIDYLKDSKSSLKIFSFIQPMTIGFLLFAAFRLYKSCVNNKITHAILFCVAILTFLLFKTPWIFPASFVLAGIATNFSNKRFPENNLPKQKIKWQNIIVFLLLFILIGYLSETSTQNNWKHRKLYNIVENNYRFSSLVFGGGDVLMPMMYEQYVVRPNSQRIVNNKRDVLKMDKEDFLTGYGIVRAIPGPVFSIGSFTGGMLLRSENKFHLHLFGCVLGSIAIFLPSALLVLFFYPIWNNLKKYAVIYRSLEGINAAVVGILFGAFIYLMVDFFKVFLIDYSNNSWLSLITIFGTFFTLYKTKTPPPLIVIFCLVFGLIFS